MKKVNYLILIILMLLTILSCNKTNTKDNKVCSVQTVVDNNKNEIITNELTGSLEVSIEPTSLEILNNAIYLENGNEGIELQCNLTGEYEGSAVISSIYLKDFDKTKFYFSNIPLNKKIKIELNALIKSDLLFSNILENVYIPENNKNISVTMKMFPEDNWENILKKISQERKEKEQKIKEENTKTITKTNVIVKTETVYAQPEVNKEITLPVNNLQAKYNGKKNEVILNWEEPNDKEFAYVKIKENDKYTGITIEKGNTTCIIKPKTKGNNKYTVVSYNDKEIEGNSSLCFINTNLFKSMNIPKTATGGAGNAVKCSVVGCNLNNNYIKNDDIEISCQTNSLITKNSNINIINDERIDFYLTIPKKSGIYEIKITCGDNIIKEKLNVERSPSIGTVIYNNKLPVAVIAGYNNAGIPFGIGLKEGNNLHWAANNSFGYKNIFNEIISIPSKLGTGSAEKATFKKDIDGKDNWNCICSKDKRCLNNDGTYNKKYIVDNYSLFNFALEYSKKEDIPNVYADNWFIPSLSELCQIYKNKEIINNSLQQVKGDKLSTEFYWSSSQNESQASNACAVQFSTGSIFKFYTKSNAIFARCIREFPDKLE